jgi:hypothetical protein
VALTFENFFSEFLTVTDFSEFLAATLTKLNVLSPMPCGRFFFSPSFLCWLLAVCPVQIFVCVAGTKICGCLRKSDPEEVSVEADGVMRTIERYRLVEADGVMRTVERPRLLYRGKRDLLQVSFASIVGLF